MCAMLADPVPERSAAPGFFVSLDGPDGGGKTTQAARLVQWLLGEGREVVACRDPGGTPLGERVRAILVDRQTVHFGLKCEMLLFMASRAQLVEEVIRPALEAGKVVVSDRYLLANVVYQGYAGGLDVGQIWDVGKSATGGLMPDLTLLLDLPPEMATARVGAPRDRIEDRSEAYRARVRAGFLEAARLYKLPIRVIDAGQTPDLVFARVRDEVERALAQRARA
jgi:dTMP kinase